MPRSQTLQDSWWDPGEQAGEDIPWHPRECTMTSQDVTIYTLGTSGLEQSLLHITSSTLFSFFSYPRNTMTRRRNGVICLVPGEGWVALNSPMSYHEVLDQCHFIMVPARSGYGTRNWTLTTSTLPKNELKCEGILCGGWSVQQQWPEVERLCAPYKTF